MYDRLSVFQIKYDNLSAILTPNQNVYFDSKLLIIMTVHFYPTKSSILD